MMKARGETWDLQLVLSRAGEEDVLATLARFERRREFTPAMRRAVMAAARKAVRAAAHTPEGAR